MPPRQLQWGCDRFSSLVNINIRSLDGAPPDGLESMISGPGHHFGNGQRRTKCCRAATLVAKSRPCFSARGTVPLGRARGYAGAIVATRSRIIFGIRGSSLKTILALAFLAVLARPESGNDHIGWRRGAGEFRFVASRQRSLPGRLEIACPAANRGIFAMTGGFTRRAVVFPIDLGRLY
jgi:hypothetical protein